MAKKKKVVPFNQKKVTPLDKVLNLTKEDLKDGADAYLLAPYTMTTYLNIRMEQKPDADLLQIFDTFLPENEIIESRLESPSFTEKYETFFVIINLYCLLTKKLVAGISKIF